MDWRTHRGVLENDTMRRIHRATIAVVACTTLACEREDRRLNEPPPKPPVTFVAQVPLQPGPTLVTDTAEGPFDEAQFSERPQCTLDIRLAHAESVRDVGRRQQMTGRQRGVMLQDFELDPAQRRQLGDFRLRPTSR